MLTNELSQHQTLQNQILGLTPNTHVIPSMIIATSLFIIGFSLLLTGEVVRRKNPKLQLSYKICSYIIQGLNMLCAIFSALYLVSGAQLLHTGVQHGMYHTNLTWQQLQTSIDHSPVESILPKNLQNKLVIYYRFGCDDCEVIYDDLSAQLNSVSDVYWISTRSKQGEALRNTYPISHVPSAVYITSRNTGIIKNLTDKTGKTVKLHQDNLTSLLQLYESNQAKDTN